jgi:hypothetical protein
MVKIGWALFAQGTVVGDAPFITLLGYFGYHAFRSPLQTQNSAPAADSLEEMGI